MSGCLSWSLSSQEGGIIRAIMSWVRNQVQQVDKTPGDLSSRARSYLHIYSSLPSPVGISPHARVVTCCQRCSVYVAYRTGPWQVRHTAPRCRRSAVVTQHAFSHVTI